MQFSLSLESYIYRALYLWLGCIAYNLGTGRGTSVLEMVTAFEKASGKVTVPSLLFSSHPLSQKMKLFIKYLL